MRRGLSAAILAASLVGTAVTSYVVGTHSSTEVAAPPVVYVETPGPVTTKTVEVKVPGPVVTKTKVVTKVKTRVVTKTRVKYVKVRPARPKTGVTGSDRAGYWETFADGSKAGHPAKTDALAECVGEDSEAACKAAVEREYADLKNRSN